MKTHKGQKKAKYKLVKEDEYDEDLVNNQEQPLQEQKALSKPKSGSKTDEEIALELHLQWNKDLENNEKQNKLKKQEEEDALLAKFLQEEEEKQKKK